ncbi:MAG: hypothetical protein V3U75_08615 [Methylococcaceae bacterium]
MFVARILVEPQCPQHEDIHPPSSKKGKIQKYVNSNLGVDGTTGEWPDEPIDKKWLCNIR